MSTVTQQPTLDTAETDLHRLVVIPSPLDQPFQDRPKPRGLKRLLVTFLGKAVGNFFWFCFFQFFFNWWFILAGMGFIAAGVASMFGCTVNLPQWMKHPLQTMRGKVEQIPAVQAVELADAKARKLAEEHRQNQLIELRAEADALHMRWRDDCPLEELKVKVRLAKEAKARADREEHERVKEEKRQAAAEKDRRDKELARERQAEEQRREEAPERRSLVERATKVDLGLDDTLPLPEMRRLVAEKEKEVKGDAAYQLAHRRWEQAMSDYNDRLENGKNGVCPYCRYTAHVSSAKPLNGIMCPKCKGVSARGVWRDGYNPPPPPREPQREERRFGGLF